MNLEVNYSGKQMTQNKFISSEQSVTLNRKSGEKAGIYNASLVTKSAKTEKDGSGKYTKIKFQIKYKQPAHQCINSNSGSIINKVGSDYINDVPNDLYTVNGFENTYSGMGHATSSHYITLTGYISIYHCGISNYKLNNKFAKIWNTEKNLELAKYVNIVSYYDNKGNSSDWCDTELFDCGQKLTFPQNISRTGYTLTGWKDSRDSSGVSYTTSSSLCGKSLNLYAQWKANQYKIHYNANGGTGNMADSTVTYDGSFTLPQSTFKKTGCEFLGWSKTKDGTVTYQDKEKLTYTTASDTTLYAVWGEKQYNVSFQPNGADGDAKIVPLKYGQQNTLPKNTYARKGYTFIGWSSDPDAANIEYADGQKVTDLADAGKTKKLYAVWRKSDGSFDTINVIHDDSMFTGDIEIEGQNGTVYSNTHTDSEYAKIDKTNDPGYFTDRYK